MPPRCGKIPCWKVQRNKSATGDTRTRVFRAVVISCTTRLFRHITMACITYVQLCYIYRDLNIDLLCLYHGRMIQETKPNQNNVLASKLLGCVSTCVPWNKELFQTGSNNTTLCPPMFLGTRNTELFQSRIEKNFRVPRNTALEGCNSLIPDPIFLKLIFS